MNLNPSEKNAFDATNMLLYLSKVRVTARSLRNALWQHPDFPSLSALSDVLTDFNVPNMATRLTPDRLSEIPLPALAHLQVDGGVFVPVRKVGSTVEWLHSQRGWQSESYNDFVYKWTGVALLIAPNATSGEREYAQNRRWELIDSLRIPFIGSAIVVCLGVVLWSLLQKFPLASHLSYYGLLATKLAGTIVSGLLVWYGIDSQNSFLQKVCQINRHSNCQNILQSPAAKLTDWLSWSEIGLFYFGGGLIYLLSPLTLRGSDSNGGTVNLLPLWGLGALALPYTFWSIWYQWRVARQWCVLCLAVQVLIWVEFYLIQSSPLRPRWGNSGLGIEASFGGVPSQGLGAALGAFLVLPAFWTLLKQHLQKAVHFDKLFRDFQRLKFDPKYLDGLLSQPHSLPPIFEGMKVIEMGNPEAEHTLILVSNPTCAACRRNHLALEKLLETTDNLKCQVILAANPQDEAGKVALQVLSLPPHLMAAALHSWFEREGQQFKHWNKQNNGNSEDPAAMQQLSMHLYWLRMAGINTAPKIFLNEVELPPFYNMAEWPKLIAVYSKEGFAQIK